MKTYTKLSVTNYEIKKYSKYVLLISKVCQFIQHRTYLPNKFPNKISLLVIWINYEVSYNKKKHCVNTKTYFERLPNMITTVHPLNKCVMRVIYESNNHRMLVTVNQVSLCTPTTQMKRVSPRSSYEMITIFALVGTQVSHKEEKYSLMHVLSGDLSVSETFIL